MAISDRIESIEEHLRDDYDVLTLAGADLTNVDKNILNLNSSWKERLLYFLNNGTDVVWENWDKVVGEGTSLSLNKTLEAKMKIKIKGNTYQDSTTGKNILGFNDIPSTTKNGMTYSVSNNVLYLNGTSTASFFINDIFKELGQMSGYYTMSFKISNIPLNRVSCGIRNSSNTNILGGAIGKDTVYTKNLNDTMTASFVYLNSDVTITNGTVEIQVETGTTKTDFEPYTNGASPNPDYPQEVHTVSGDNEVEVVGKNLVTLKGLGSSIGGVSFTVENGIIKINGTTTGGGKSSYGEPFRTKDGEAVFSVEVKGYTDKTSANSAMLMQQSNDGTRGWSTLKEINLKSTTYKQISTTLDSTKYYRLRWWVEDNTFTNAEIKVMLEYGTEKTSFEPYQSTTYPINLPEGIELCKIGTYQDKIDKSTGKNLFDEEYELGTINFDTGALESSTAIIRTKNYQSIKPSTQYTLKVPNEVTGIILYYYNNGSYIGGVQPTISSATHTTTFTTNASANQVKWRFNSNYTTLNNQTMLNKGSTALPYEPYGTSWYLEKKIKKILLNGSESWTRQGGNASRTIFYTNFTNILPYTNTSDIPVMLSSHFISAPNGITWTPGQISRGANANNVFLITSPTINTKQNLVDWLSENNTMVYYAIATPTYTKIEGTLESQLNALSGAKSYNSQTNISQTNNNLASLLNATALEEI